MQQETLRVQCPQCLDIAESSNPGASRWDCPCGYSWVFLGLPALLGVRDHQLCHVHAAALRAVELHLVLGP
ncbi:MAG: hypothetical protein ACLPUO_18535 [Streptosporangiaceae bacterium]